MSIVPNDDMRPAGAPTAAGKMVAVLEAFRGAHQDSLSLAELAVRAGLSKPTCHRLLSVLEEWGGVERTAVRRYRLGLKMFELGGAVQTRLRIRDVALPYMEDLVVTTGETVNLARLDGPEVLYLERLFGHQGGRCPSRVGGRMPAACSALGKAILAFSPARVVDEVVRGGLPASTHYSITSPDRFRAALAEIRCSGCAHDYQECRLGLVCVAAPIFGAGGEVVAALSVAGRSERLDVGRVIPAVRAAGLAVSRRLGCPSERNSVGGNAAVETARPIPQGGSHQRPAQPVRRGAWR
jgi:DNA-binding IclR family transcriptional regulator